MPRNWRTCWTRFASPAEEAFPHASPGGPHRGRRDLGSAALTTRHDFAAARGRCARNDGGRGDRAPSDVLAVRGHVRSAGHDRGDRVIGGSSATRTTSGRAVTCARRATALGALHDDPDRLRRTAGARGRRRAPRGDLGRGVRRGASGCSDRCSDTDGATALTVYVGNPVAHNLAPRALHRRAHRHGPGGRHDRLLLARDRRPVAAQPGERQALRRHVELARSRTSTAPTT